MGPGSRFRLRSSSYGGQVAWPGRRCYWFFCFRRDDGAEPSTDASHPGLAVVLDVLLMLRLLLPRLLLGVVTAVEAAGGSSKKPVVTGIMTGDAANGRALQAALGVGGRRSRQRERGDSD